MRQRERRPDCKSQAYWVREEQVAHVKALAKREGVSASVIVREAIDDLLEREAQTTAVSAAI